jgi:hypothetical protein
MYARVVIFEGPRGPELVAAAERAGRERILPTLSADPEVRAAHRGTYVLRRSDGQQVIVAFGDTADMFDRAEKLINESELLPGEDAGLLRQPDHFDIYEVVHAADGDFQPIRLTAGE